MSREPESKKCDADFVCDTEFAKLTARCADVDLTLAALEIARDAQPGLDFGPTLMWLDARAAEIAGPIACAHTQREALAILAAKLHCEFGLTGDPDCYSEPDSSFLNRVIETGRGLPIALSIVYMAVAERVGLELCGVASPMHFLTRAETEDDPVFVDAFRGGVALEHSYCLSWIMEIADLDADCAGSALRPVGSRMIIVRLLNNLKVLYLKQENFEAAFHVQCRLTALEPASYRERRDLAMMAIESNRPGVGLEMLEGLVRTCPRDEKPILCGYLDRARSEISLWN